MNQYQQPPGRWLEVIVGILCLAIGLVFLWLATLVAVNASLGLGAVVGMFALGACCVWFTSIAYRLVLGRKNKYGGLLSTLSLQAWCVILGICFIGMIGFSVYMGDPVLVIGSVSMAIACWYGFGLAKQRRSKWHEHT